jgi:hypothetical protein
MQVALLKDRPILAGGGGVGVVAKGAMHNHQYVK